MKHDALQDRLGFRFRNPRLLGQALTHRSHSAGHNERLEFIGDSILNCVIAVELHERFPLLKEGELSRLRATLVKEQALHELALGLGLGDHLRLGEGELKSGGFRRPSILADALEALFGAAFLDAGFDAVRALVVRLYGPLLAATDPKAAAKDPKTRLQEWLQSHHHPLPEYRVIGTHGAAHDQRFEVECVVRDLAVRTLGAGNSRRFAEQEAARLAYLQVAK